MSEFANGTSWTRHFFYRSARLRTTWTFRAGFVALLLLCGWFTRGWFGVAIAKSLVCDADAAPSDAILVENFDPTYLTFETAARLRRAGVADRVIVPVAKNGADLDANPVALGIAELMARLSRLGPIDVVPIREVEPISLNAAKDILDFARREHLRSVVIVSPLFRSRRSMRVYNATLGAAGIRVTCEPVRDGRDPNTWLDSWHGMENVLEQFVKLQYYNWYVLPFKQGA